MLKDRYTLETHMNNIEILESIISFFSNSSNIKEMFYMVNTLTEFIVNNEKYSFINEYLNISDRLVEMIEFCNSDIYSDKKFILELQNLICVLITLRDKIVNSYKIIIYYYGNDKCNLLYKILNENVILADQLKNGEYENGMKFNILLLDKDSEDMNKKENDKFYEAIYDFDQIIEKFLLVANYEYNLNYDYNYLKGSIDKAKEEEIDGIIVGSSYPLYGVEENKLNGRNVKLALSSQDLFYSYKIARDIIDENSCIERCYIGIGYWTFCHDLSKCKIIGYPKIKNTYFPIYFDSHNYELKESQEENYDKYYERSLSYIFDIKKANKYFSKLIYNDNSGYFIRKKSRNVLNDFGGSGFKILSVEEKRKKGWELAQWYNRLKNHLKTREENVKIFEAFLKYLTEKGVEPIVINFRQTKYFTEALDVEIIDDFERIIDEFNNKYVFKYIDLNSYTVFDDDEDFVDFNHLSYGGACKVTSLLNGIVVE